MVLFPAMSDPSNTSIPQFGTAEYVGTPSADVCQFCKQPISQQYYRVRGQMACGTCAEIARQQTPTDSHSAYVRALVFGIGGWLEMRCSSLFCRVGRSDICRWVWGGWSAKPCCSDLKDLAAGNIRLRPQCSLILLCLWQRCLSNCLLCLRTPIRNKSKFNPIRHSRSKIKGRRNQVLGSLAQVNKNRMNRA